MVKYSFQMMDPLPGIEPESNEGKSYILPIGHVYYSSIHDSPCVHHLQSGTSFWQDMMMTNLSSTSLLDNDKFVAKFG